MCVRTAYGRTYVRRTTLAVYVPSGEIERESLLTTLPQILTLFNSFYVLPVTFVVIFILSNGSFTVLL